MTFTADQKEYNIEDVNAPKSPPVIPEPETSRHPQSKTEVVSGIYSKINSTVTATSTTTTVKYLKSVHPDIRARTLKHHERSKKIRITLINLLAYEVSLTRKNQDNDRYSFVMKLKMLEETQLLTDIGDELGVFTIPDNPKVYPENILDFTVDAHRVSHPLHLTHSSDSLSLSPRYSLDCI